ncbi:MAG TPA: GNAT family protein [Abditibacteriaceae bacterium]|jgi:RimJ/RimL family protein N-acetyltransferase
MNPLLIPVPEEIETARLLLRSPRVGEGPVLNEAVCASLPQLQPWMPWAQKAPTLDESEEVTRDFLARFIKREELSYRMWLRGTTMFAGTLSLHRIDWNVPKFEIGYWLSTRCASHGYMTEAVNALSEMAFETLSARRVEIRCDARNVRSSNVAKRCGFKLEGTLRKFALDCNGEPCDAQIWARVK